ncbi:MAG: hypothetical protein IJV56_10305 [Neisseriaceae bacterium]|nr:hypothetical protein [Neisseriaceae bacterium]
MSSFSVLLRLDVYPYLPVLQGSLSFNKMFRQPENNYSHCEPCVTHGVCNLFAMLPEK